MGSFTCVHFEVVGISILGVSKDPQLHASLSRLVLDELPEGELPGSQCTEHIMKLWKGIVNCIENVYSSCSFHRPT